MSQCNKLCIAADQELLRHLNGVRLTITSLGSRRKTGHSHTYQYLHFESHHLTHMKRGVVRCLHDRAWGVINMQDNLQKEVDHLARVLKQIGFHANFSTTLLPHPHRKQQTQAPQTRDKRWRGHWWYPMWQVWVRTSSVFASGGYTGGAKIGGVV